MFLSHPSAPKRLTLIGAACLLAGLAACGGGGSDAASEDTAGAAAAPQPRMSATRAGDPGAPNGSTAAQDARSAVACPTWSPTGDYEAGEAVSYQGSTYTARVAHTLAPGLPWLPPETPELWQAGGGCAASPSETAMAVRAAALPAPAASWREQWLDHRETLKLLAHNDTVALYVGAGVPADAARWVLPYLTRLWQYQQQTHGTTGTRLKGTRLYAVLHQGRHLGGHMATVHHTSHGGRNVIDVGSADWSRPQYEQIALTVGSAVEALAAGTQTSAAAGVLGKGRAAQFHAYDGLVALGYKTEAAAFERRYAPRRDSYPRNDTHWFRDWFAPLWREHGHAQVMVKFHSLAAKHFPREGTRFVREMNWGEYVYFMSAAAGKDLQPRAQSAFGWNAEREAQYRKARSDFPGLTGSNPPVPAPGCNLAGLQAEAMRLINQRRAAGATCGSRGSFGPTGPLKWNDQLAAAADAHSQDMARNNYFSHTSRDGRSFTQRIEAAGYRWSGAAENIAAGQNSVAAVIDGWMKSDGHCANLMGRYQDVALACAAASGSDYGRYWTLDLATPR
ncbi:CAP domain-containing protein [Aquabacterium sp. A7-Y]|uniref:CAP domain-containing protein n=1 Tax=Aquabacterium sp. A7-Y TaxID=1349605 RepID=UPI00223E25DF|nr:CAP domain-containing protein [Aquabacterium sp. A7-Y]MCW7540852.1 CAP domain-containing protein [Aquabacterium sp. A7-Y]